MIGKRISNIMVRVESMLLDHEANSSEKPYFTKEGFRAITKVFHSALIDKMYELQLYENMDMDDKLNMARKASEELSTLIKVYADIDTFKMYKNYKKPPDGYRKKKDTLLWLDYFDSIRETAYTMTKNKKQFNQFLIDYINALKTE